MEGVLLEHFKKMKPSNIPMAQFHSRLSDESDQDYRTTVAHPRIILLFIITKQMISPLLTTMWDHMYGFPSH